MFEYEKKVMLTQDEYSYILTMYKSAPRQTQTNYYFDTADLAMNDRRITCRIRAKNGKYKATVKNHNIEHPDCSMEAVLVEKTEFDPQIFNALGLHYQGELVTERIVMHKDSTCETVLDKNVYLGHTDFELEVEYCRKSEPKAKRFIEKIAERLAANKQLTSISEFTARIDRGKSKSERFFERLKGDCQGLDRKSLPYYDNGVKSDSDGDCSNDISTAIFLPLSTWIIGRIDSPNAEMWYRFTAGASNATEYTVYTDGSLDTMGYLYDSDGNLITDNDGGSSGNFSITRKLTYGATYYVKVRAFGNETGNYNIMVGYATLSSGTMLAQDMIAKARMNNPLQFNII